MDRLPKRQRRRRQRALPPSGTPGWTARDVHAIRYNPVYGYGLLFEPSDTVVDAVRRFVHALAAMPEEFTLPLLDEVFQRFFAELEASGHFRCGPDVPPLVDKAVWLQGQLQTIRRLRAGEEE